jgi:glycosyltransferase involved in cell wall biosynthesis
MPDDLWSRGKCGLKVLQYMAAGLPVVANPVGVQAEMVRHAETGFLAGTDDAWIAAIGKLAAEPELRRKMGLAARQSVARDYSVARAAESWLRLLSPNTQKAAA